MIIYDADEAKYVKCDDAWRSHPRLEAWTGADFMISPLTLPIHSQTLLARHVEAGAFLVQVKRGWDLTNSLQDQGNLWEMLQRMIEFGERHKIQAWRYKLAQRIVLGVGVITGYADGTLKMNGQAPRGDVTYWQVDGAIERIFERGGVFTSITGESLFGKWLQLKEHHVKTRAEIKYVIPKAPPLLEQDAMMQRMIRINDARKILRSFMSERQANALFEYANGNGLLALSLAFDPLLPQLKNRPAGISHGFIAKNRDQANAHDGEYLAVVTDEREPKREYKKLTRRKQNESQT